MLPAATVQGAAPDQVQPIWLCLRQLKLSVLTATHMDVHGCVAADGSDTLPDFNSSDSGSDPEGITQGDDIKRSDPSWRDSQHKPASQTLNFSFTDVVIIAQCVRYSATCQAHGHR